MPSFKLGQNAKLYVKSGGVASSNPWIEVGEAKDVTLNMETAESDASTRGNAGWKATVATQKDASIDFQALYVANSPSIAVLQNAFMSSGSNVVGVKCLDGVEPAGEGLIADMMVASFTRNEALNDPITFDLSLKITASDTAPVWKKGA